MPSRTLYDIKVFRISTDNKSEVKRMKVLMDRKMKQATVQTEKMRLSYFPHVYNYIVKEELVQKYATIDESKIRYFKKLLTGSPAGERQSVLVAEKIIKGE